MKLKWNPTDEQDPYCHIVESFAGKEFPQLFCAKTENIVDAVTDEFLATKQIRLGPKPNLESIVAMRDVVRRAVNEGIPIPVLTLSAAVKVPLGNELDLAELSAIRILGAANERVKRFYPAGLNIRVRMEDLTELVLSKEVPNVFELTAQYIKSYTSIVKILGYSSFIHPVPESTLTSKSEFLKLSEIYVPAFMNYLETSERHQNARAGYEMISNLGWKNPITQNVRDFLSARYSKVYPQRDSSMHRLMMAEYFSATLARHNLKAVGFDTSFEGRLEIAFNPPLPNAPFVSTRVQYRSVPLSETSDNRPYWYAKGYLKISNDNEIRLVLGNWQVEDYHMGYLTLEDQGESVSIRADYMLE